MLPKVVKPVKKAETYQPSLFDDLLEPAVEEVQLTGVVSGKFVLADDGNYKKLLEDACKEKACWSLFHYN